MRIHTNVVRIDAIGKNELPKHKRNARVFERFRKTKKKNCAPYKRQKIVSKMIITFCPVNLDNTNLRKQTNVHLLWGQASLIIDEKGSTKINFNIFTRRLLREKTKISYNIQNPKYNREQELKKIWWILRDEKSLIEWQPAHDLPEDPEGSPNFFFVPA